MEAWADNSNLIAETCNKNLADMDTMIKFLKFEINYILQPRFQGRVANFKSANCFAKEMTNRRVDPSWRKRILREIQGKNDEVTGRKCQVTLQYSGLRKGVVRRGKPTQFRSRLSPLGTHDEVMVLQQPCGSYVLEVFHGHLEVGDIFQFTSRRAEGYPFSLAIYVNRQIDARLSTCCEAKKSPGTQLLKGRFLVVEVNGTVPCLRCLVSKDPKSRILKGKLEKRRRLCRNNKTTKIYSMGPPEKRLTSDVPKERIMEGAKYFTRGSKCSNTEDSEHSVNEISREEDTRSTQRENQGEVVNTPTENQYSSLVVRALIRKPIKDHSDLEITEDDEDTMDEAPSLEDEPGAFLPESSLHECSYTKNIDFSDSKWKSGEKVMKLVVAEKKLKLAQHEGQTIGNILLNATVDSTSMRVMKQTNFKAVAVVGKLFLNLNKIFCHQSESIFSENSKSEVAILQDAPDLGDVEAKHHNNEDPLFDIKQARIIQICQESKGTQITTLTADTDVQCQLDLPLGKGKGQISSRDSSIMTDSKVSQEKEAAIQETESLFCGLLDKGCKIRSKETETNSEDGNMDMGKITYFQALNILRRVFSASRASRKIIRPNDSESKKSWSEEQYTETVALEQKKGLVLANTQCEVTRAATIIQAGFWGAKARRCILKEPNYVVKGLGARTFSISKINAIVILQAAFRRMQLRQKIKLISVNDDPNEKHQKFSQDDSIISFQLSHMKGSISVNENTSSSYASSESSSRSRSSLIATKCEREQSETYSESSTSTSSSTTTSEGDVIESDDQTTTSSSDQTREVKYHFIKGTHGLETCMQRSSSDNESSLGKTEASHIQPKKTLSGAALTLYGSNDSQDIMDVLLENAPDACHSSVESIAKPENVRCSLQRHLLFNAQPFRLINHLLWK